jgi:hypothetical protein
MITKIFHPPEDESFPHAHDYFQPYLGSCDAYYFERSDLLNIEHFQPAPCSNVDGYKVVAIPKKSETHSTKKQYFHLRDFCRDLWINKLHTFGFGEDSFSRPKVVPYLISPSQGIFRVFLGSLISSQSSGSSGVIKEDEDKPSSM